jgi:SAM-dependent methyltransferase
MNIKENYVVNNNSDIYYKNNYWNDYPFVRLELNHRASSYRDITWYQDFKELVNSRCFNKALILNCGNGWVERLLYSQGIFKEAVGIDYSEALLQQARQEASVGNLPFRYYQMDVNSGQFPEEGYDLVINHAAAHHMACIDRVFRLITSILPEDGYFVSYDYVGPHRNQYSISQWEAAWNLNQTLSMDVRQDMRYPHLPTMLVSDPTEAIHSELIIPVMKRYFHIEKHQHLGGALAYLLLTFNENMQAISQQEQLQWLKNIMEADYNYLMKNPGSSLFDYIIARPAKESLINENLLEQWTQEENQREKYASQNQGMYYDLSMIQELYLTLENQSVSIKHLTHDLHQLMSESPQKFMYGFLLSFGRRILNQIKRLR